MALSQRTSQQSARREEIEANVLAATESLLAGGETYADLKVEQIATAAGISRPAFYFYFRDNRELLMPLTEGVADDLYAEADAWWSGDGEGAAELRRALGQVIALYRSHGLLLRAVVEASAYDQPVADVWRALMGGFALATRDRMERELRLGVVGPMPAREIAFSLCWMTERACYQRIVAGEDLDSPDFVEALVRTWAGAVYGRVP